MHGNETDNQVTGSNQSQSPLKKHFRISPAIQRSPVLVFRVQTQREVWFKVAFYLFFFSRYLSTQKYLLDLPALASILGKWEMILIIHLTKQKINENFSCTLNGDQGRHFLAFAIYECASVISVFIFYFN